MRWLFWTPVVILTTAVGVWGLRIGWVVATIDESDVILKYAQRYVIAMHAENESSDARLTDCHAVPGEDAGVWIVVICGQGPCGLSYREFHLNRIGGFVHGGDTSCSDARLRRALI